MKKILLTMSACLFAFAAQAQLADRVAGTYSGELAVSITTGETTATTSPQVRDVMVNAEDDGQMEFQLDNFILNQEGAVMPVGSIRVSDIDLEEDGEAVTFTVNRRITIEAGDDPSQDWMGPMLSEMPDENGEKGILIDMQGRFEGGKLTLSLDIPFSQMGMQIGVTFDGTNPEYEEDSAISSVQAGQVALASTLVDSELAFTGIKGAARYAIYNVAGHLMDQGYTSGRVNVSTLAKGIYLVQMGGRTVKFVKK